VPEGRREGREDTGPPRPDRRSEAGAAGSFDDLVQAAGAEAAAARRRAAELGGADPEAPPEAEEPETAEAEAAEHVAAEHVAAEPDRDVTAPDETPEGEVAEATAHPARRRRRFRPVLLGAWFLILVACAAAVAALSGAGEDDRPQTSATPGGGSRGALSPACRGAWAAAAGTARVDRSAADLDAAVQACRSPEEWRRAARAFPRALGGTDPLAHLRSRCRAAEAVRAAALCEAVPG
jgi:hypothetical protein